MSDQKSPNTQSCEPEALLVNFTEHLRKVNTNPCQNFPKA